MLTRYSVGTSPAHYAEPGCSSDMLCGAASQINSLTIKLFTVRSWQYSSLEATHAHQERCGVQANGIMNVYLRVQNMASNRSYQHLQRLAFGDERAQNNITWQHEFCDHDIRTHFLQ